MYENKQLCECLMFFFYVFTFTTSNCKCHKDAIAGFNAISVLNACITLPRMKFYIIFDSLKPQCYCCVN